MLKISLRLSRPPFPYPALFFPFLRSLEKKPNQNRNKDRERESVWERENALVAKRRRLFFCKKKKERWSFAKKEKTFDFFPFF